MARVRLPVMHPKLPVVAKGAQTVLKHSTRASAKTRAYDDFTDPLLPDWVMVHGKFSTTSGNLRKAPSWSASYAAGYHRTQMLSDNHRVKITIPSGSVPAGKSRIWLSGDNLMNRYYGVEIDTNIASYMSIVKGFGPNSVKRFDVSGIDYDPGDEIEVWFDRDNSTIRGYQNGVEQCGLEVPAYEIQHGPGHRYVGAVLGADWFLEPGINFADFEAWDVVVPGPFCRDTMDGPDIEAGWNQILNSGKIHRHWFLPQSMGPDYAFLFNNYAVLWDTPASQDSVKVVFSAIRAGTGLYTVVICSNSDMTSWIGVQFEQGLLNNHARIVTGTGPLVYTQRAVTPWVLVDTGGQYTVTYDHSTKTTKLYKAVKKNDPIVSWVDNTNIASHGSNYRFVGQLWENSLFSVGVEPTAFEAYNVTALSPL